MMVSTTDVRHGTPAASTSASTNTWKARAASPVGVKVPSTNTLASLGKGGAEVAAKAVAVRATGRPIHRSGAPLGMMEGRRAGECRARRPEGTVTAMRPTRHLALLALIALLALLALPACLPGSFVLVRNLDGQTWAARFDVAVGPTGGPAIRFPVDLALTFRQTGTDVTADASLEYNSPLLRIQTDGLTGLTGRLGFDDRLDLESRTGLLTFEGRFVRNRLVGTVAIAGVAPVGDVVFERVR